MSGQRTHYVTTSDGVTIGGTVHGAGPALVFLQDAIGDGDLDWERVVGHLADRFTCHLPNMRGRGLSGDHPDLNIGRLVDDVLSYIDSIGEPTGLVGWSLGAGLALLVSARSDTVTAVAPLDPLAISMMDEQERAAFGGAIARAGELAADGSSVDAVHAFAAYPFNDTDIAMSDDAGYFEASGRYVHTMVGFFRQQTEYTGPVPDDPSVLSAISAPMIVLHGSDTTPFGSFSARYVAETRIQRTGPRDRRRWACRPPDPSRGPRRSTQRLLRTSPASDVTQHRDGHMSRRGATHPATRGRHGRGQRGRSSVRRMLRSMRSGSRCRPRSSTRAPDRLGPARLAP